MTETVQILTARMDADSFAWCDALRRAHFPADRNVLSAHLTMFHRLSPRQVAALRAVPLPAAPLAITFDHVRFLGAGNALGVVAPDLLRLREHIKAVIGGDIARQDAQRWMPHVTVQNKVTPSAARTLHAVLVDGHAPRAGTIDALQVWDYLGGPWRLAQTLPFGA